MWGSIRANAWLFPSCGNEMNLKIRNPLGAGFNSGNGLQIYWEKKQSFVSYYQGKGVSIQVSAILSNY